MANAQTDLLLRLKKSVSVTYYVQKEKQHVNRPGL